MALRALSPNGIHDRAATLRWRRSRLTRSRTARPSAGGPPAFRRRPRPCRPGAYARVPAALRPSQGGLTAAPIALHSQTLPPAEGSARGPAPSPALAGLRAAPRAVASSAALRRHLWYARRSGLSPRPFLRTPRVLLRRGPCPCAGPLRRGAPAAASRPQSGLAALPSVAGAGPRGSPPALSLGLSSAGAPAPAPPGSRWPRLVPGSPPLCCGLPPLRSGRPCSALAPRAPARGPAGSPPPRPLRGFGPGGFRPRGPRGLWPRLWWLSPPGPPARPRLRGLAVRVGSFLLCLGPVVVPGSPLASPPRPCRPRWGLAGSARPEWVACGPPPPSAAAPPGRMSNLIPRAPLSPPRQGGISPLTFPNACAIMIRPGPNRPPGGRPPGCP